MQIDKNIPYRWQVRFKIEAVPSLQQNELIIINDTIYKFEISDNETYVNINFETNSFDGEGEVAKTHKKHIYNLMLNRMIYQENFGNVNIEKHGRELLNTDDLIKAGLRTTPPVRVSLTDRYDIKDDREILNESHEFMQSGIEKKIEGKAKDESMIYSIGELLHLAKIEADYMASFILTWNAFNWLYTYFDTITNSSNSDKQAKMFKNIVRLLLNDDINDIRRNISSDRLSQLISYEIMLKGGRNVSQELDSKIRGSAPDVVIIISVLECIYGMRNHVFHEGPIYQEMTSEDLAERAMICNSVLTPIVTKCLKNFVDYES